MDKTLRNGKLNANRASETEDSKERPRIRCENKKTENHKKQRLDTQKLKRGNDNELERKLRLEKVVASEQLRLALETEEERRATLENDAATAQLILALILTSIHVQYLPYSSLHNNYTDGCATPLQTKQ